MEKVADLVQCEPPSERRSRAEALLHHDSELVQRVEIELQSRGVSASVKNAPKPGTILNNRFQLVRQLGEGGQGQVWEAFDNGESADETGHKPERCDEAIDEHTIGNCAVKLLNKVGEPNDEPHKRFDIECQLHKNVVHPNVVRYVTHAKESEHGPYLVMDLIRGESLVKYAIAQSLSIAERVEMMSQVLAGLQSLHDRNLYHRDIKPANIVIGLDGIPRIVDLGLSLDPDCSPEERLSRGRIPGTGRYMAPELVEGHDATAKSDVYACGVTLIDLLTAPQTVDPASTKVKEAIRGTNRVARDRLWSICRFAAETNPALRAASAASMRDELASWMQDYDPDKEGGSQSPEFQYRRDQVRRLKRRGMLLRVVACFLMVAVGGVVFWRAESRAAQARAVFEFQRNALVTRQAETTASILGMLLESDDPFRQVLTPGGESTRKAVEDLRGFYESHQNSLSASQKVLVVRGLAIRAEQVEMYDAAAEWYVAWLDLLGGKNVAGTPDTAAAHAGIGRCALRQGLIGNAYGELTLARTILQDSAPHDRAGQAAVLCELADCHVNRGFDGDGALAEKLLNDAEDLVKPSMEITSQRLPVPIAIDVQARISAVRARCLAALKGSDAAEQFYSEAIDKAILMDGMALAILHSRVNFLCDQQRFQEALPLAQSVVQGNLLLFGENGNRTVQALLLQARAARQHALQDKTDREVGLEKARLLVEHAVGMAENLIPYNDLAITNARRLRAAHWLGLGRAFAESEEHEKATEANNRAYEQYRDVITRIEHRLERKPESLSDDSELLADAHAGCASALRLLNRFEEARSEVDTAIKLTIARFAWDGQIETSPAPLRSRSRLRALIILEGFRDERGSAEKEFRPLADAALRDSQEEKPTWADRQGIIDVYLDLLQMTQKVSREEAQSVWDKRLVQEGNKHPR
ncbi:MAG: serine/threonine protein kinase [Phycisphaerales bacterium]|nr:serine/threonine protein kinase [Phycisphaerales bacterium]